MSDLLNQASLVMVPSGYKEDTVYSVVPSDGSGDLAFTRASNGTRVNSAGLVEVCPWNMAEQSNTFSASPWVIGSIAGTNPIITANYGIAPDGTLTAQRIQLARTNAINSYSQIYQYPIAVVIGQTYTWSVWLKSLSGTPTISIIGDFGRPPVTLTSEWVRYTGTGTASSGLTQLEIAILGSNYATGNSLSADFLAYGYQLNIGATAKPYFPTTDRLNVPRLTYQNGGGGCPSLLLEKQSTNLVTYSEQFDNAGWTKLNSTITANSVTSPDGTQNADTITDNTTNGPHYTYQFGTQTTGTAWTCYMKKGSLDYGFIGAVQSSAFRTTAIINLTNGSIVELQNGSSTTGTVTAEDCGNGWYRVKMQTNANGAGYSVGTSNGAALSGTNKEAIYTGTGSGTIYLWGAQLEDSTYATSYIVSTSSSATRVADACYRDSYAGGITNEGTIFADFEYHRNDGGYSTPCLVYNGSLGDYIYLYVLGNTIRALCSNGGVAQSGIVSGAVTPNTRYKVAAAYKTNDFVLYINGSLIGTDTSGTMPTFSNSGTNTYIGTDASFTEPVGKLNEAVIFPTRLTNAELASLTTI